MTKKNYIQDRFFGSKRDFTTKHGKLLKFQVFPGKVATLNLIYAISMFS